MHFHGTETVLCKIQGSASVLLLKDTSLWFPQNLLHLRQDGSISDSHNSSAWEDSTASSTDSSNSNAIPQLNVHIPEACTFDIAGP